MSLRVSVVVCTHTDRRLHLLQECVTSLIEAAEPPHELFVVVDSNPALSERLGTLLPEPVRLLASAGRGVSVARNTGIEAATGDLIAFIDDDAMADSEWLTAIVRPFDDPAVIAAGGRIVPRWEVRNWRLPEELFWVVGCTYAGHPIGPQPISRPIACNMAARRSALRDVGGFPREFGPSGPRPKNHSNEEIALAIGLRNRFGQDCIRYVPDALVRHFVPADRTGWRYLWQRCIAEGVSKADVRLRYGTDAMGFDRDYARATLLPAIWRYARQGLAAGDPASRVEGRSKAVAGAGGLLVTASAYAGRLLVAGVGRLVEAGLDLLAGGRSDAGRSAPAGTPSWRELDGTGAQRQLGAGNVRRAIGSGPQPGVAGVQATGLGWPGTGRP